MKYLILYLLGLMAFGLRDVFRRHSYDDFVVAGRKQGTWAVLMSLMATMIGASATLGIAAKAEQLGGPAFWWLGCGAVGLLLQGMILSEKIRGSGCRTLPELAEAKIGLWGRRWVAGIIALSWIGIIAAQFAAAASLLQMAVGWQNAGAAIGGTALLVILYTWAGGQLSVVRTDMFQFAVLSLGFVALFLYLNNLPVGGEGEGGLFFSLFSEQYGPQELLPMMLTVGGAYFLGPDITSRNFLAKSAGVAKRSVLLAAPLLLLFSLMVTRIGIWAGVHVPGDGNPLFRVMSEVPLPLAALVSIGLICALVSSADTCLMNTATITTSDLLGLHDIRSLRWAIILIGLLSALLALWGKDIIQLLLVAYSVYTPGIVFPLAVAILTPKTCSISRRIWYAAVVLGGGLGLLQAGLMVMGLKASWVEFLSPAGMILSLVVALLGLRRERP